MARTLQVESINSSSTGLDLQTLGASRLFIDNSGNVGIGITSPAVKLELNGSTRIGTGNDYQWNSTLKVNAESTGASGYLRFFTNSTERLRITGSGGISFGSSGTAFGTSNQVLKSNGDASPTWILLGNDNIDASAAIVYSKLNLATSIVNGDISASAAIAYSKLNLTTSIVNGDIASGAAIAVSKLAASTISGITLGSNLATLTFGTHLTGTSYNGSTGVTIATNATNANTVSTIVARDGSGNFSAGTITANLTGNVTGNATGISNSGFVMDISTGTYGSFRVTGLKAGYVGTEYSAGGNLTTLMFDNSGNGGLFTGTVWPFYYNKANNSLGIGNSTTSASYILYANGAIYATGNIVAYSDERAKTNWKNLDSNFIERLSKVKSGTFNKIDTKDLREVGVSAQSLRDVIPEAVFEDKDNDGKLGVAYGNAALAACIELAKEIINLKKEIEFLKNK